MAGLAPAIEASRIGRIAHDNLAVHRDVLSLDAPTSPYPDSHVNDFALLGPDEPVRDS